MDTNLDDRADSAVVELTPVRPKRIDGIEINPAEEGYIIYRPGQDCVHYLNPTAVFILELCTGDNSTEDILDTVTQAYGLPEPPVKVVQDALATLKAEGLLL